MAIFCSNKLYIYITIAGSEWSWLRRSINEWLFM